ncbi:hypothetical protein CVT24_011902 [Panaeolus cyanescens]|uniref:Uncharacterized protein n=1 Tax=Panaeolus cyanescens TaxID=181874 RepID=A0A409YNS7_9AGAR|nr:hypothetical protein CVT24_011902 [Panaeolus cyanescens]
MTDNDSQLSQMMTHSSSSTLLYLLPPCLIFIAFDAAVRITQRRSRTSSAPTALPAPVLDDDKDAIAQRAVEECKLLAQKLKQERRRSAHLQRMIQKQRNFAHHRERLVAQASQSSSTSPSPTRSSGTATPTQMKNEAPPKEKEANVAFTAFCERLLLQNRIWKQQREIKTLRDSLSSSKSSTTSSAFQTFCDRILIANKVWKLQKEVDTLTQEAERLKRGRVLSIARAAKKMVLDVQKDRLTEDFVKELLVELDDCKKAMASLREEHEREIQEITEDWRKDCRQLARQVEILQLAQQAHSMEQLLANEAESEMIQRIIALQEAQSATCYPPEAYADFYSDNGSEIELDRLSNMSTSTCVGSGGVPTPLRKLSFGENPTAYETPSKPRKVVQPSPLRLNSRNSMSSFTMESPKTLKSPVRKLEEGEYVGFSFNPIFFSKLASIHDDDSDAGSIRSGPRTSTPYRGSSSTALGKRMSLDSMTTRKAQWRF